MAAGRPCGSSRKYRGCAGGMLYRSLGSGCVVAIVAVRGALNVDIGTVAMVTTASREREKISVTRTSRFKGKVMREEIRKARQN